MTSAVSSGWLLKSMFMMDGVTIVCFSTDGRSVPIVFQWSVPLLPTDQEVDSTSFQWATVSQYGLYNDNAYWYRRGRNVSKNILDEKNLRELEKFKWKLLGVRLVSFAKKGHRSNSDAAFVFWHHGNCAAN